MDLSQLISSLRIPKAFREIITFIGGFGFLLILWLGGKFPEFNFVHVAQLNRVETDILILITCYLVGKIILFILHILNILADLVNLIFVARKHEARGNLLNEIKHFFLYTEDIYKPFIPGEIDRTISIGEFWETLAKNGLLEQGMERDFQAIMFSKFFFSYSILLFWIFNPMLWKIIMATLSVYFLILWYGADRGLFITHLEIQKHIVKKVRKQKEAESHKSLS